MDDQGFDFQKEPERRERKPFEPPPWERDAFEQLQRRRQSEQPEPQPVPATPQHGGGVSAPAEASRPAGGQGPSEAEMVDLLAGLAAEEQEVHAPATQITAGAAIVLLPIGAMMVFWGVNAFTRSAGAATGGGLVRALAATLFLFGAGVCGAAFWLIYRLMKQRGVL